MPDYSKSKIYKIVNTIDDEVYVGSTCRKLAYRFQCHVKKAKEYESRKIYDHLNSIGWENVSIELIEEYPCDNKEELLSRERHWVEAIGTLNSKNPYWSTVEKQQYRQTYHKQYRHQNHEKLLEDKKRWYQNNKERILEKRKQLRKESN